MVELLRRKDVPDRITLTIHEWELFTRVKIIDPDGFDRTNPDLYSETFTYTEFMNQMEKSTVAPLTDDEWFLSFISVRTNYLPNYFDSNFMKKIFGEYKFVYWEEGTIYKFTNNQPVIFSLVAIKENNDEHLISYTGELSHYHWYQPLWQYYMQQIVIAADRDKCFQEAIEHSKGE